MKNDDRFFGLHFDLHAENDVKIGNRTNKEDVEKYLDDAKPDFVQCDSKGHPGNCSYPTKVGTAAKNLETDNLKIWVDAIKGKGLPVFVHYSGVIDRAYTAEHPEDATLDKDGKPTESVSLFSGKYLENRMIPELKEMIVNYGIDGVWADGECWGVKRDYSKAALSLLPEGAGEKEHNALMRKAFFSHLKSYTDALHEFCPDFKVISNWAYSSYIPEEPTIDVDYLSGDYSPENSVHEARYQGRCLSNRGKKWDLMAWSFEWKHWTEKPAVQLMQEAAVVLSLGGGFQLYIPALADGSAPVKPSNRLKEIGEFVRARRFLYNKEPMAQVAVLFSADSFYERSNIFNAEGATDALCGALNATLDAGYTANVIYEYQLSDASKYPIILIPEWKYLSDATINTLIKYAEKGGHLVVIGADASARFLRVAGKEAEEVKEYPQLWALSDDGRFAILGDIQKPVRALALKDGDGKLYSTSDVRDGIMAESKTERIGKGTLSFLPFVLGSLYYVARSSITYGVLKKIFDKIDSPF
ncbi:MAG: alpha-L-fucosidase, partial [Clostridia bacterium]|nr:alpha-L-fucosidase [Clostridia bacterium]